MLFSFFPYSFPYITCLNVLYFASSWTSKHVYISLLMLFACRYFLCFQHVCFILITPVITYIIAQVICLLCSCTHRKFSIISNILLHVCILYTIYVFLFLKLVLRYLNYHITFLMISSTSYCYKPSTYKCSLYLISIFFGLRSS